MQTIEEERLNLNKDMKHNTSIDQYETIIWDWNGTLLNDIWLCLEITNHILAEQNKGQLDEAHYKEVFGFPVVEYYQRIGIDFERESFAVLAEKWIASYNAKVRQCQLHDQVVEVLDECSGQRFKQFILTAAHKESVWQLLHHYSIRDHFTGIEGLDNARAESKVQRGKQLIRKNRINPQEAVLIGDTIHDYEVAQAIGVDCILIANGHQSRKRLEDKTLGNLPVLNEIGELMEERIA